MGSFAIVESGEIKMNSRRVRWSLALISMGAFAVPLGIEASDMSAAGIQGSLQPGNPTPNDPNKPKPPRRPNSSNPPSGPNNPNPPSGPAPTAPSGPGSTGGTGGTGGG